MFSEASVILSTGKGVCIGGGGCADPPYRILRDMVNKRVVRILLECILVL